MDILSYPVGLLIGLFPVIVDLGISPQPAELILDGRPACSVSARAPACTIDLGPDPVIHLLELVRRDKSGGVTESVRRWVNKPGVEAEVRAAGRCEEKTSLCTFTMTWAHPAKLDPASLTVALDGVTVSHSITADVRVPFPRGFRPQVVTADASFPDGRRATFTQLLQGSYPERAEASLQAIPVIVQTGVKDEELAASLREVGWPLRAIEQGGFEIVFIVEPGAFGSSLTRRLSTAANSMLGTPLAAAEQIRVIVANDSITVFEVLRPLGPPGSKFGSPGGASAAGIDLGPGLSQYGSRSAARRWNEALWLRGLILAPFNVPPPRRLRTSDAVAVAGYHLGGSSRRRAVVLIAGSDRPDESTFSVAQARTYLEQTQVPLFVWRAAAESASGWPAGSPLLLDSNVAALRRDLDRQRIVWLEGAVDARDFHPRMPPGVTVAGREASPQSTVPGRRPPAAGDAGGVFAVAVDPESPQTAYAGTRKALEVTRDGGAHWEILPTGGGSGEMYSVALEPRSHEILFGSSGAIGRSVAHGESWAVLPTLAVFSVVIDPNDPNLILAGTRGGVLRSTDGGSVWRPSSKGLEKTFTLSIAADGKNPGVFYAATAGSGVFKSTDGGKTWKASGRELDRTVVRCVTVDPGTVGSVYAGTDGGVFVSVDQGKTWEVRSSGLPRAVVYALAADPSNPLRFFAGTAEGLFETGDGARNWKRANGLDADTQITSLAFDPSARRLYAGTLGRGVVAVPVP